MIKLAKYSFVFILLILCTSIIIAQNSIQIYSRYDYSHDYVEEINKNNIDSLQSIAITNDQILNAYSKGYISAGYDSVVSDSTSLRAYLTYGPQYYWKQLNYVGFENQERELKSIRKKAYVDYTKLQKLFLEILNYEAQRGYPFAQINFSSLEISEDSLIYASLDIDKGQYFSFDSVIIKGEPKIKNHYIEKYLEIKKGEKFSIQKVNDIDKKLKNLRFVEQSRPYQLAFSDDKAYLLLYLKNKKANSFNGMIGILPNNKTTGKLLVTGDVNLLLMNSVGIGELFEFRWQKFDPLSQKLNTELAIPYLFKTQFGVGTKFDIEKIDSSYLNTDFTGKILFGSNSGSGFEIFYRKSGSYILREVSETEQTNLTDFSTNLFGVNYRYINADNVINPKSGILFELSSGFGTKIFDKEEEVEPYFQNRSHISIAYYLPIYRNLTIKLKNHTSMIYSKEVFDNELDLIGGLNSIRGFDELSLPVSSYSVFNTELRYLFEEESALFAFYDIAYFEKRYTLEDNNNYAMGIGFGIDLSTNAGIFSLVFAVGKQNSDPLLFNSSKIHIGYRSLF